ncbi:hypothetical protein SFOMI_4861 [Sphingobium fuliginis]|uniref:Uncharacterized protein n=1 Tax=Sphingobium fuliginis (strain ATCC 27551) TaxID=336203 RepID=A0A292ZN30_SPHSA|nr:hypothetical protein SFOMI_4861 [Sphingobium fuliginis]
MCRHRQTQGGPHGRPANQLPQSAQRLVPQTPPDMSVQGPP